VVLVVAAVVGVLHIQFVVVSNIFKGHATFVGGFETNELQLLLGLFIKVNEDVVFELTVPGHKFRVKGIPVQSGVL